jgi:hypothetical protein
MFRSTFIFICLVSFNAYSFQATVEFAKADSIAELYPRHPLNDLEALSKRLTADLSTEEEKFRAIYKWVCNNIDNDYYLAETNRENRARLNPKELVAWNIKMIPIVNRKLMYEFSTVCTGYAWLIKELAAKAGIKCEMVHGYGRTSKANIGGKGLLNHTWNAVKLSGVWFLCDATWSSGALDMQARSFVRDYEDAYFLAEPEFFIRNHYPVESKWALLDQPPTLDEFLNRPLIYAPVSKYNVLPAFPERFNVSVTRHSRVDFQFTQVGYEQLQNVKLMIGSGNAHEDVEVKAHDNGNVYSIGHVFTGRGTFAVHILVDDTHVISYSVSVK